MAKLTYSEQLKHPHWQRKRLEVLQEANFTCEKCSAKEKTLHVHHKRYVKGRQVWEYDNLELQVLCEECHSEHHESHALLEEILATCSDFDPTTTALGLVGGYLAGGSDIDSVQAERARLKSGPHFTMGVLAWLMSCSGEGDVLKALKCLQPNMVTREPLAAAIAHFEHRIANHLTEMGE